MSLTSEEELPDRTAGVTKVMPDPDDMLIADILQGRTERFEDLLDRYQNYVFAIVSRYVPNRQVEDVAQEVCIRCYRSLATYKGGERFKGWLATIAVRTCYDSLRAGYRRPEVTLSELSENQSQWLDNLMSGDSGEQYLRLNQQREAKELLDMVLEQLSPADQLVIRMVHFEECSAADAANKLGLSVANVKVRAFRSRKKLKKLLESIVTRSTEQKS